MDISKDRFFQEDPYKSLLERKQSKFDKLFFNTRYFFYFWYCRHIYDLSLKVKKNNDIASDEIWNIASYKIFKALEFHGCNFIIEGHLKLKDINPPVVYVSNHMSTLETMVLPFIINSVHTSTFVMKESLAQGNIFGRIMRGREPILLSRKDPREDLKRVLKQGVEKLNSGISIILFPQGTRSDVFEPEKFNSLGMKLAIKAGVSVVPIALKTDCWSNKGFIKGFGPLRRELDVRIKFGKEFSIKGNGREEHKLIKQFINDNFQKWVREVG